MSPMNLTAAPAFQARRDAHGTLLLGPVEFDQTLRGRSIEADVCGASPLKHAAGRRLSELPFDEESQASQQAPVVPFAIVDPAVIHALPAGIRHTEAPKKVESSLLELVVVPSPKLKENH